MSNNRLITIIAVTAMVCIALVLMSSSVISLYKSNMELANLGDSIPIQITSPGQLAAPEDQEELAVVLVIVGDKVIARYDSVTYYRHYEGIFYIIAAGKTTAISTYTATVIIEGQ